jgi:hypothetical protein
VSPYLRLLVLRTRRAFLPMAFGLPALGPTGIIVAGVVFNRLEPTPVQMEAGEVFVGSCFTAILATVMVVANLTAFLVHDERQGGRGRLLRLATIDGRAPVAAHLCLASLIAAADVAAGLCVPGAYAVGLGLPPWAWLAATVWAGACVTTAGALGLWIGYLLPRTVAMVAVQMAGLWLVVGLGSAIQDVVKAGTLPVAALAWVALLHLMTLLVLPPLWRRTSARLW